MRGLERIKPPVMLQGEGQTLEEWEDADFRQGEGGAQKEGAGGGGGSGGGRGGGVGFGAAAGAGSGDVLAVEEFEGEHFDEDELLCVRGGEGGREGGR